MPLAVTANSQVPVTPFSPYSILSVCLPPRPLTLYPPVPLPPTPPPFRFRSHPWNPFPMLDIKKMTTTKKKMKCLKKVMAYKKYDVLKEKGDSIFATPAPRPPIDAQKKVREKNEMNEGDSLNQSPASDTASSRPTDMLSLHDSLVHDGPGVSPIEAGLADSTSNASARDLDDPRHAFTSPSRNHTPPKPSNMNSDKGPNEALSEVVMSPNPESTVPQAKHLEHNPIKSLSAMLLPPPRCLANGFPGTPGPYKRCSRWEHSRQRPKPFFKK